MADGILASVPVYNSFLLSSSPGPSLSVGSFSTTAATFSRCSTLAKGSVYRARPIMTSPHCKSSSSGFDSSPSSDSSSSQQPSLLVFSGFSLVLVETVKA
ncbi:hypothetical protein HPP92_020182 [Vanilla planifolia]|uniref:Uncharacterized protein n=1 Tax=Vanilla planifolia TaxID=51239 RepID=A0A835Q3N9_VANPL|nr:hypothetical protein HPP92_020182 [Vanilla planifolia]